MASNNNKRREITNKLTMAYVSTESEFYTWGDFLQYVGVSFDENVENGYAIVDEAKWLFAKLKYGI